MSSKILLRRGTAAQWSSANPILGNGEVGIETDTLKIKIGNGTSTWSQLTSYANVTPSELTSAINSIIDLSPSTLDTLNELAAAINDDPNFFTSVNTSLSDKASLTSANTFTASPQTINIASTSAVGLVVKAASGQTANVLEVKDGANNNTFIINSANRMYQGNRAMFGVDISYPASLSLGASSSLTGFVIRGAASQTANLQEWQNSAGTVLIRITSSGVIGTTQNIYANRYYYSSNGTDTGTSISFIDGVNGGGLSIRNIDLGTPNAVFDNVVPLTISGNINQTANLQNWKNSAGTVLASISASGAATFDVANPASISTPLFVSNSGTGVNTAAKIQFKLGGFANSSISSVYLNSPSGGSALLFATNDSVGNEVERARIANNGTFTINGFDNNAQGLVVKGAASQTANLQEWQNSSGTVIALVNLQGVGRFSGLDNLGLTSIGTSRDGIASLLIDTNITTRSGIIIKGVSSQTADLQQWKNNSNTTLTKVTSDGRIVVSTDSGSEYLLSLVQGSSSGAAHLVSQGSGYLGWVGLRTDSTRRFAFESDPTNNGATFGLWQYDSAGTNSIQVFGSSYGNGMTIPKILAQPLSYSITPLIVKGVASQTADLQQWQDSAGSVKALIGSGGNGVFNGIRSGSGSTTGAINAYTTAAQVGILIRGAASQTANLTEWQDSSGTILSKVDSSGNITAPSYNLSNSLYSLRKTIKKTVGDGTAVAANTTYDLFQFNFSSSLQGTFYFQVSMRGSGYGQNLTYSLPVTYAMDWLSQGYSGNPFTSSTTWVSLTPQTFSGRHLMIGDNLKLQARVSNNIIYFRLKSNAALSSGGNSPYFDVYIQHSEEFAGCTITEYSTTGTDTDSQTTLANFLSSKGGTTELFNPVTIFSNSALNTPIKIKGFSSQNANLQEWQDSTGTLLSKVTASGVFGTNVIVNTAGTAPRITLNDASSTVLITAATSSLVALTTKAAASQTANLQEWQNSSGTVLANVTSSGAFFAQSLSSSSTGYQGNISSTDGTKGNLNFNTSGYGLLVTSAQTSAIVITARAASSQTGDLQQWQNSSGTALAKIDTNGALIINNSSGTNSLLTINGAGGGQFNISAYGGISTNAGFQSIGGPSYFGGYGGTGNVVVNVTGASGQTADLQRWTDFNGTVLAKITATGDTTFGYTYISGVRDVNGTGAYINMQSADGVLLNTRSASNRGLVIKGSSSQTAALLEFVDSNNNSLGAFNSNGLLYIGSINNRVSFNNSRIQVNNNGLLVDTGVASNVALTVQSTNASQTGDLQQWKNSAGTVLAKITASGSLELNGKDIELMNIMGAF